MAVKSNFASGDVLTASDVNTYLTNGGLVYITQATATSGGTMNIAGCFTSTYASYRLIGTIIGNSATAYDLGMRFYAGAGSPVNTGYYWGQTRVDIAAGTSNVVAGNNSTYASLGCTSANAGRATFVVDIINPQLAQYTAWTAQGTDSRGSGAYGGISTTGQLTNTTQYDSVQFGYGIWGTGTISNLTVNVYGYRQP